MPKIVVENDQSDIATGQNAEETAGEGNESDANSHTSTIPTEVLDQIVNLRESLKNSVDNKKSAIFADSLAELFDRYQRLDSAARYSELAASNLPNLETWEKAGESYYKAYSFAVNRDKQKFLGEKAKEFFEKVLKLKPERLDLEAKIAMTLVSTSAPMEAVMRLRAVLEKDPENEIAIFNLGTLSMQSGQYDKAVGRFKRLVEIDPKNSQALFYLGISYFNLGDIAKAKEHFLAVKEIEDDPAVLSTVDGYLKEIE
ncbi:MAG: tetratricopeptide repeat protein [Cytophagales bacterium]|nr:tetratricopeptide repeat protein [Cytophagales bacterium]